MSAAFNCCTSLPRLEPWLCKIRNLIPSHPHRREALDRGLIKPRNRIVVGNIASPVPLHVDLRLSDRAPILDFGRLTRTDDSKAHLVSVFLDLPQVALHCMIRHQLPRGGTGACGGLQRQLDG